MDSSRFQRIERLYEAALAQEPARRRLFLEDACGGDDDLKRELERLLADEEAGDHLLDESATALLSEVLVVPLSAGTQIGSYRIEGFLGAGGMAEVYLAHDPRLDRRVAIKLLPERFMTDRVAQERLRREALAAAALDHPFICKILEVGDEQGALFCVMELVRGETLFARLRAGRLALLEALRIAGEVAEALEDAHASRIMHRDLKPSNIMLTVQGHVKVMDFGLARRMAPGRADEPLTDANVVSGTLEYMSPEQATGGVVDERTDLFSFGIVLAELVNGKHPFQRGSPMETLSAILRDPPDLSAATGSTLPAGLIDLIRRLLARQPEDRYSSMREVRADLSLVVEGLSGRPGPRTAPRATVIGRDEEAGQLLRLLDDAMSGHGALALISGEAGIGKTHLARAIQDEAARRGCFAVTGHCYEMEGAPPYVPFIEMLEQSARLLPRASFRHALGDAAPEVARLMPELRRVFPDIAAGIDLPPDQQRRFLFNAYREFVERGARVTPLVAVFEDLQWADESTLLLFQHVAQTLPTMAALVIGTYRDLELDVSQPFARTVETLVRDEHVTRLRLPRLPLAETGTLLETLSGQTPPPSTARLLYDHTEGNPFFLKEVFRHLTDAGELFDGQGRWQPGVRRERLQVPRGVRLVIGRRIERLPEDARRVIATAAVIGRSFDLPLLEALEPMKPEAVFDAIEAAEHAHLIEPETMHREARYRFVHELIRQTLTSSLSLPRRQRLHARVAQALERLHGDRLDVHASALAHHLYQAGAAADADKTVQWLTQAAQQATTSAAHEDALAHLENALALVPGDTGARVAELHAARATALRSLGRMPEAMAGFERALALFEAAGEVHRFAETCITLAMMHAWMARLEAARDVCVRGLELIAGTESPTRLILQHTLALTAVLANDIESGLEAFEQVRLASVPPVPALVRSVGQLRTFLHVFLADLEIAQAVGDDTDRLCEAASDLWGQQEVAWMRADLAIMRSGRYDEGVAIARRSIPRAEKIGHWGAACFCTQFLFEERVAKGDLEGAAGLATALEDFDRHHYVPWGVVGWVTVANIARLRGRVAEAIECCRRATFPERNHWSGCPHAALALTFAQSHDARLTAALEHALPFAPLPGRPAPYGRWPTLSLIIEALAAAGRTDEAGALHPAAEDMIARGFVLMKAAALPRTTAGIAAACARKWSEAEVHHQRALHQADTWSNEVCLSIARYWYADMLWMRDGPGDWRHAHDLLTDALKQFVLLGMPLYADAARAKLAA